MSIRRLAWATAVVITAAPGLMQSQEPSLAAVTERLGAYATAFQQRFSNIVAEERYVQDVTYRNVAPNRFAIVTHRELRSDLLLVRPDGADRYLEFRDVFEVDGRPVRDRQDRLTTLFLHPSASAEGQIQQINRESARYNIGNIERTINTPTLPLQFLLPRNQQRFRFTRTSKIAPAMGSSSGIPRGVVLEYDEVQRPTLIRTTGGLDLPAHGRFWIDAETGRVLMTELIAEDLMLRATIDVRYEWDPRAELMVPADMHERYDARQDGAVIRGVATYGRVRQFQVQADERLGPAERVPVEPPSDAQPIARATEPLPDRRETDVVETSAPDKTDTAVRPLLLPTSQDRSASPTFKAATELVVVDFVVTDKADRLVRGLSARDFVVKEDGKERPIVSFEAFAGDDLALRTRGAGPEPASSTSPSPGAATVLLVDDGQLSPEQTARLRPALKALLTTVSERSGTLMLVAPWSKVSVAGRLPTVSADLDAAVDRIVGQRIDDHSNFPVDDAEALAIFRGDLTVLARVAGRFKAINPELTAEQANDLARERANLLAHDARTRRDDMYGVALQCLDWLTGRPGRHSLIVVSAGITQAPDDSRYFEVVTRSLRANAPIHFLDARGLPGIGRYQGVENGVALNRNQDEGAFGRWDAAAGSMAMADDTGGIAISNSNDMAKGLRRLLDTMTTYYVLSYQPPHRDKPGYRKIKVEVRTKGLQVRARTGYVSGSSSDR